MSVRIDIIPETATQGARTSAGSGSVSGGSSPYSSQDALLSLENAAQGIRRDIMQNNNNNSNHKRRNSEKKTANFSKNKSTGTLDLDNDNESDPDGDEFRDHNDEELFEGAAHVHYVHRAPWLRAAVLGANDGLISTAAIMLGIGAVSTKAIILGGFVSLVGGALSMGIGEFVSVSSQLDTEKSDIERERAEHAKGPEVVKREAEELLRIYMKRGLSRKLARKVVEELHSIDAVAAHVRDELGIDVNDLANPYTAALSSAGAFIVGAAWPVVMAVIVPAEHDLARMLSIIGIVIFMLAVFGGVGAYVGGASIWRAAMRVCIGGSIAMGMSFGASTAAEKLGGIKI